MRTNLLKLGGTGVLAVAIAVAVSVPASAQVSIVGNWDPIFHEDRVERIPGPDSGDYAGLAITDAARQRADAWSSSILTLPEHQCKPHPSTYGWRGVGNLRITPILDDRSEQVVAYEAHIRWQEQHRTIWMDGRPHPPEFASHTWQGFSTGEWIGDTLKITTTHLKAGWIRRNGVMLTDQAYMTEYITIHDNVMTHVYFIEDPDYLTEPLIKTNGFILRNDMVMEPYPCSYVTEVPRTAGSVPHYLPGTNPDGQNYAEAWGIPFEAVRGGAETALPEFIRQFDTTASMTAPGTGAE
jgi:hypothetical protein